MPTLKTLTGIIIFWALSAPALAKPATQPVDNPLSTVRTFMYQLQNLENPQSVAALAKSDYDLLVVEPTGTTRDNAKFDMKAMVARLHEGKPGRIVLAYVNAGQAESYRQYWQADWKAPKKKAGAITPGAPDFILVPDPDGWSDNYPVAYWDQRWQEVLITGKNSELRRVMAAGFDGVYLDWIDAYDYAPVVAAAKKQHIDPARAMVDMLLLIRQTARAMNPHAVIVQQNAYYLLDADARLKDAIDGLGVEDTWFSGKAEAKWGTRNAGDIANRSKDEDSTAARLKQYRKFLTLGKAVLTIDYCRDEQHAAQVYKDARKNGLVPLVSQVSLDRMTQTPPPAEK